MKNQYLQNNFDRLKSALHDQVLLGFNIQISQLQNQIDDNNKKSILTVKIIEEENDLKIQKCLNDKDLEIKNLLITINNLDDQNFELTQRINDFKDNAKNLKLKGQDLNKVIEDKEIYTVNLREEYEGQINDLKDYFEKERLNLIKTYEDTIQK